MHCRRNLIAGLATVVTVAAHAQVGTHGESCGVPYGPQQTMSGTDGRAEPPLPKWATSNPWSTPPNRLIRFQSVKSRKRPANPPLSAAG